MKMSNIFKGLHKYKVVILPSIGNIVQKTKWMKDPSEIEGIVVTPEFLLKLTPMQSKAIELAVNNHDASVEALKSITKKLNWNGNGSCDYCGSECPNHKDDCDYIAAVKLLDKIKGESE